jgi:hypothetical protein
MESCLILRMIVQFLSLCYKQLQTATAATIINANQKTEHRSVLIRESKCESHLAWVACSLETIISKQAQSQRTK